MGLVALPSSSTVCGNILAGVPRYFDDTGISHAVVHHSAAIPTDREVQGREGKTSARIVLMDDNHYDPLNASDRLGTRGDDGARSPLGQLKMRVRCSP